MKIIKECPWCFNASDDEFEIIDDLDTHVRCKICFACGPAAESEDAAQKEWNTCK